MDQDKLWQICVISSDNLAIGRESLKFFVQKFCQAPNENADIV